MYVLVVKVLACGMEHNILSIYGLNLAWHWQFVCKHVHLVSPLGTVIFWFMLLRLRALDSV